MSTYYNFYTEAKVNGTWYCIDSRVLRLEYGDTPMTYQLNNTYWNGSRSYFSETYDKLEDLSRPIKLEDTSSEFRMHKILDWRGDDKEISGYYDSILRVIPYQAVADLAQQAKTKEYHGVYKKDDIVRLESGEIDDLYGREIDPVKYSAMAYEARRAFQYYEWNDPMSWRHYIPILLERINNRIREFEDVNYDECDEVRIIMYCN